MHRRGRKVQPSSDDLGSNGQWAGIGLCIHDDSDDVYNVVVGAFYAQHLKSWQSVCSTGTVSCN